MNRIYEVESPCPPDPRFSKSGRSSDDNHALADLWDTSFDDFEDTAAVEFTTEIRAPLLTATKPRRVRKGTSFQIHEDGKPDVAPTADANPRLNNGVKRKKLDGKSTMLAQPAQRFQRPRVSFAVKSPHEVPTKDRRSSSRSEQESITTRDENNSSIIQEKELKAKESKEDNLKKDVRRRTIYIPSEDTTMPTVFMSLFSPLKSQDPNTINTSGSDETVPINSLEARIAAKRQARTSLAAAPRRAPLQQKPKVTQETTLSRDVVGKNGGKENIPPGYLLTSDKGKEDKDTFPVFEVPAKNISKTSVPKNVSKDKVALASRKNLLTVPENKKTVSKAIGQKSLEMMMSSVNSKSASSTSLKDAKKSTVKPKVVSKDVSRNSRSSNSNAGNAPTKLSVPKIPSVNIDQKYPLLTDDISNPIMYEDNWLSHQEVVITQLVNGLFDSACGKLDSRDPEVLRHELLGIYQDNSFVLLYKRLHASLLYGALAVPKDVLARGNRLGEDLGMKRTFLNFWVETYDLHALRAAAETVIGRRISNPLRLSNDGRVSPDQQLRQQKTLKRALEAFLDIFLIRNEDRERGTTEETSVAGWGYRRTILRSILMIVLLDKGRLSPQSSLPRCLFVPSSRYKSSTAALQALGNQLLPSVGDITRPLGHLDCQVSYKQHPLQEYEFQINNLAVDLRDGVLLTRLVELLLYPSTSCFQSGQDDSDASNTLTMPTGEVLPLKREETDWPLSQHLKFPCSGRATKLFNVQIALSALRGVQGIGIIAQDVRPEDIVDGYREKTIALLWGLVGKWGLAGLVDWDDVRKEIARLQRKISSRSNDSCYEGEFSEDEDSQEDEDGPHAFLLKKWASALAQLKGLRLENFTTSFTDGKIFESIIEEYEPYIIGSGASRRGERTETASSGQSQTCIALEARLRALGCSSQFASLVSPSKSASRIFDRDFILGALAFLCSRLLSASKRTRAALILQSAWRRTLALRTLRHRILAKKVATECAAVVHTRDRILWAKEVIVNWWREQKARRSKAANSSRRNQTGKNGIPKSKVECPARQPRTQTKQYGGSGDVIRKQKQRKGVTFHSAAENTDATCRNDDLWLSL